MTDRSTTIALIGVPFDLCGRRHGSRLGPAALRLAGLATAIAELGHRVEDIGDVTVDLVGDAPGSALRHGGALTKVLREVRSRTASAIDRGAIPVVLGGDHSIALGSVAAARDRCGDDLGVLWIDAHADVNTPGSSDTGNVHGMPLAALLGLDSGASGPVNDDWLRLLAEFGSSPFPGEHVAWYGLRDVDPAERPIARMGLPVTMHDVDRYGVVATIDRVDRHFRELGVRNLWISFDVDALDPILAPGTGTAVRGGLTYRESHLMAELLSERLASGPYRLVGLDLVETNPLTDSNNRTAKMTVEWIASLLGKTILGS